MLDQLQEGRRYTSGGDGAYFSEGDGDAGVQLNVIRQLRELVLLLLKRLQQAVDLLLCQHNSAVVLQEATHTHTTLSDLHFCSIHRSHSNGEQLGVKCLAQGLIDVD